MEAPGIKPKVISALMIHDRVVCDSVRESSRYAKVAVSKKALEMLAGLAPFEFRAEYGCNCKVGTGDEAGGAGNGAGDGAGGVNVMVDGDAEGGVTIVNGDEGGKFDGIMKWVDDVSKVEMGTAI
jgi:endoribonuclease Dicer